MTKAITNTSVISLIDPYGNTGGPIPISAYDFSKGLIDQKGSNHGTQVGSLDYVKDRFGTGVSSYGQGSINLGSGFNTQTNFFCSFWIKMEPGLGGWIINQYTDGTEAFGLTLNNDPELKIYNDIDNANDSLYPVTLTIGKTYHIVFGINSDKLIKMWIDGVPCDNDEYATSLFSTIGGELTLLSRIPGSSVSVPNAVSNVEIFDQDLTDSDVQSIYNRGQRIKSFFDRGLIASGKTFSSGFIENSPLFIDSGSLKIDTETINGYVSKTLGGTSASLAHFNVSEFGTSSGSGCYGTWNFCVNQTALSNSVVQLCSKDISASASAYDNYNVLFLSGGQVRLRRQTSTLISSTYSVGSYNTIRITRNYAGLFKLWIDGSLVGSTTDNTYTNIAKFMNIYISMGNLVLQSENSDYNFFYSPLVIEPN